MRGVRAERWRVERRMERYMAVFLEVGAVGRLSSSGLCTGLLIMLFVGR